MRKCSVHAAMMPFRCEPCGDYMVVVNAREWDEVMAVCRKLAMLPYSAQLGDAVCKVDVDLVAAARAVLAEVQP